MMNVVVPLASARTGWIEVGRFDDIPRHGARVVETPRGNIAIFRTRTDKLFAIDDRCPHRHGPLSQGIVMGESVTCPLHNWMINLTSGEAEGADSGCVRTYALRITEGRVFLSLARHSATD